MCPKTQKFQTTFKEQTNQMFLNIEEALQESGVRKEEVVKCNVFLTELDYV